MTDIAHFPRPGQNYPYVLLQQSSEFYFIQTIREAITPKIDWGHIFEVLAKTLFDTNTNDHSWVAGRRICDKRVPLSSRSWSVIYISVIFFILGDFCFNSSEHKCAPLQELSWLQNLTFAGEHYAETLWSWKSPKHLWW